MSNRGGQQTRRDVGALTLELAVPAIHLVRTTDPSTSQLGGQPRATADFVWPNRGGRALTFLTQIDLARLQGCARIPWLPDNGHLLFFYNAVEQPWGFDPKDAGAWTVVHVDADATALSEMPWPATLAADQRLPRQFLSFRRIQSLPSSEREAIEDLDLSDAESDAYADLQEHTFEGRPHHQMGGYPAPIQGDDMERQAQLVSNGIYCGNATHQNSARSRALEPGAANWRLLLQLDSDEDSGTMWGDGGTLYFWIHESDARERRFDRAWLVLQCY